MSVGHQLMAAAADVRSHRRYLRDRRHQRDVEWPVAVRAATAYAMLCRRLLAGDGPEDVTADSEDGWAYGLTPDERAALNALQGANYGPDARQWFGSDHPIIGFVRRYLKWRL